MELHYGQIIERTIRRKGYSISEVARFVKVNRRSVYYWFEQQYLKKDIIYQIGLCLKHDFSVEFPHLFKSEDFEQNRADKSPADLAGEQQIQDYWKNKYLEVLEKYNDLLIKASGANRDTKVRENDNESA
jgi:hypothetical protein